MPDKLDPETKQGYIKSLITILVIFSLYIGYLYLDDQNIAVPQPAVIGVTTSTPQTPVETGLDFEVYFTTPDNHIENHLIEKINGAKSSINLAVFEFDLDNVKNALIKAHQRGVRVQIVYDDEHTKDDPQMTELISSGIKAIPDERSAFMHNKFFVIDSLCVWTGSFNLSVNASTKNNENAIYLCDQKLAQNYETEFSEMFVGNFGSKSPANTPFQLLNLFDSPSQNYFAPEDQVMDKVIREVSRAKVSVHFMAFSFTDDDLGDALKNLQNNGVNVIGIFESRGADTDSSECQKLLRGGSDVRLDGNPYTFHHKVIILDGHLVIFGSFNFSQNANQSNDENLLIIDSQNLATSFEEEFQKRLAESFTPSGNSCSK